MKENAPPGVVEFDSDQEGAAILGGDAGAIIQYSGNALKSDDPEQSKVVGQARLRRRAEAGEGHRADGHLHRGRAEIRAEQGCAIEFLEWYTSRTRRLQLAEAGSIPVKRSASPWRTRATG